MRAYNVKTTYTNRTHSEGVICGRNRIEVLGKLFGQLANAEYGRVDVAKIEITTDGKPCREGLYDLIMCPKPIHEKHK